MHLCHLGREELIRRNPSESPAGHGVRLGKTVAHNDPIAQLGILGGKALVSFFVYQLPVHIVTNNEHVTLLCEAGDRSKTFPIQDTTRGIVRRRYDDGLRMLRSCGFQHFVGDLKPRIARVHEDRSCAIDCNDGLVKREGGRRHDNLIARVENACQSNEERFSGTAR